MKLLVHGGRELVDYLGYYKLGGEKLPR
jgi:hypothetical protein